MRVVHKTGMAKLIDAAMDSIKPSVSKNTWSSYKTASEKLKFAFADFAPEQITAAAVWEFRDAYASTPNMTNRCLSLLRQILNYAVKRQIILSNPALGVDAHQETGRDRLITGNEYRAIYEKAGARLQCIMDILYMTGQRVNDVLTIHRSDLTDEGIYFKQQKTKKKLLVRWTPELRAVVDRAKGLNEIPSLTLFQGRYRKAPDYRSVALQWTTACKLANVPNTQLRDLRAMSLTATEDEGKNATALAGHSSPSMTNRYLRGKKIAKVDGPTEMVSNTVQNAKISN